MRTNGSRQLCLEQSKRDYPLGEEPEKKECRPWLLRSRELPARLGPGSGLGSGAASRPAGSASVAFPPLPHPWLGRRFPPGCPKGSPLGAGRRPALRQRPWFPRTRPFWSGTRLGGRTFRSTQSGALASADPRLCPGDSMGALELPGAGWVGGRSSLGRPSFLLHPSSFWPLVRPLRRRCLASGSLLGDARRHPIPSVYTSSMPHTYVLTRNGLSWKWVSVSPSLLRLVFAGSMHSLPFTGPLLGRRPVREGRILRKIERLHDIFWDPSGLEFMSS